MSMYTLTINKDQAQVLTKATEILARLGIGQFRDALECLPTHEFLSLIHISEPTRRHHVSRMPSSA